MRERPTDGSALDIAMPCTNLFSQLAAHAKEHGNPYLEGYRWGTRESTVDTRIRRSYVTYPIVQRREGGTQNWRGKVRGGERVWRVDTDQPTRSWLLEEWDKQSRYRPLAKNDSNHDPVVAFGDLDLQEHLNRLGNAQQYKRPSWFARGAPPDISVRPHADPPPHSRVVEMPPDERPADRHFRERLDNFAARYDLPRSLVGLSWRVSDPNIFWDTSQMDRAKADGTFPGAQPDCCLTEYISCAIEHGKSWAYSSEFWIEERRLDGWLCGVTIHNQTTLRTRLEAVFNPQSSSMKGFAFPATHVEWRVFDY